MNLRQAQREAVRQALIREGMRLLARQGFAATTVDQIASAAGVAKGTFYNYFATKEDLALAALPPRLEALRRELEAAGAMPLRAALHHLLSRLVEWTQQVHPDVIWLWCIENLRRGADEPASRLLHRLVTDLCARGQAWGELQDSRPPEELALDIEGIALARLAAWYHSGAPPGLLPHLLAAVDTYLAGAGLREEPAGRAGGSLPAAGPGPVPAPPPPDPNRQGPQPSSEGSEGTQAKGKESGGP
ncbi:TetR/AcrR family transcriptional regulator [Thermaerobacter sp. PB12/4term]|uniref:TetR/AcrR family transcriptional regulator n=1 Tax=Thermaerobacter sp. PB12/4term TaxID=2293838 RepID=UPI000E327694|nr:TetR/AcrR family transcriptional regulator [Thermaerobacter sp. PB12/4term]QIA27221.1 TetR/AcrR family transcriptional regulator [Thermaerobacter sp. PB12/4term]